MEGHDRMINAATQCLREAEGLVPPVQQQLDSKMSQGKSNFSEKLAMLGEINDYLEKLEGKNNEIDRVMNQIEEMLEMRDYELTEKEMVKVKRLLMGVEAKSQQAGIYVEAAEKALVSLPSEVDSYQKEQGVSGWNVHCSALGGAGVGAASVLGLAVAPAVAPLVAPTLTALGSGAIGGGVIGGVGRYAYETDVNHGEYKMLTKEAKKLGSRLNILKTDLAVKQPLIDKVEKILNVK
ncbi:PREDICTED: uncharacterized protein LOC107356734 [Acropora digitifera]|uniref:uncharacterized protein LOC107356734 n=1 Tax=Acropora digitifera TaxID=70779 RepID=UPI00077AB857|nr:PREDICTED: uncharacterized protein LOC107356734 [Acropora digitifera]XP_015778844.1 PREDICTED: uncharacterized protein LOC107356734 [Acropora digitifera]